MHLARILSLWPLALAVTHPHADETGSTVPSHIDVARQSRVDLYIDRGLPFLSKKWGPAQFRTLSGFRSVAITEEPGQEGDGQLDSIHEFEYADMKVWLWCVPKGSDKCLVQQVTVQSSTRKTMFGIRVGDSSAALRRVFGPPHRIEKQIWRYFGYPTSAVHFFLEGDRIQYIVWDLYTG